MVVEPGVEETQEEYARDTNFARSGLIEKVGKIVWGHQVVFKTMETSCGCGHHDCSTDDVMRNEAK